MIYGSGGGVGKQIIVSLCSRQVFSGAGPREEMLQISDDYTIVPRDRTRVSSVSIVK